MLIFTPFATMRQTENATLATRMIGICVFVGDVFAIRVIGDCVFGGDAFHRIGERYPCVAVRASSLLLPCALQNACFSPMEDTARHNNIISTQSFLWDRYYWHGGLEWEVGPHTGQQYHF